MDHRVMYDTKLIDIETTGLNPFAEGAAILQLGYVDSKGVHVCHLADVDPYGWKATLHRVTSRWKYVGGHNVKFDLVWLRHFGVELEAVYDTMIEAHLVNSERSVSLKSLMADEMGGDWTYQGSWDGSDSEGMARYLVKDLIATKKLHELNLKQLTKAQKNLHDKVIIPVLNTLVGSEHAGILVSRDKLEYTREKTQEDINQCLDKLLEYVPESIPRDMDIKWGTTGFQRWLLFDHLGIEPTEIGKPTKSWPEGAPSMSSKALSKIDHPIVAHIRELSRLNKVNSGFIGPYTEQLSPESRLYTSFRMAGTRTGRLSSGSLVPNKGKQKGFGINLQQVPKNPLIRGLMVAPEGYKVLEADFSQLELRVAAALSGDEAMLEVYRQNGDIHHETATALGHGVSVARVKAKAVNFGFLYGMSARTFVEFAKVSYGEDVPMDEAEAFREAYFSRFPGLRPWHARAKRWAHKHGYAQTLFGRRRYLPDLESPDPGDVALAERQAVNTPVQGTGSDCLMMAIARLSKMNIPDCSIFGLVHDSVLMYVPQENATEIGETVKSVMETPIKGLNVPLVADVNISDCWGGN